MRVYSRSELTWQGDRLHLGRKALGVSIVPDANHPGMWRIRVGTKLSDMVNRSRARDAARVAAVDLLNEYQEAA